MQADQSDKGVFEIGLAGELKEFVGGAFGDDLTLRDDDDAVTKSGDFLHDVTGEKNAAIFGFETADDFADGAGAGDVETVRGFVEDYVLGIVDQGAGDGDFSALAMGETSHAAVGDSI